MTVFADGATGLSSMHALTGERLTLRERGVEAQQEFQQQVPCVFIRAFHCEDVSGKTLVWSTWIRCCFAGVRKAVRPLTGVGLCQWIRAAATASTAYDFPAMGRTAGHLPCACL